MKVSPDGRQSYTAAEQLEKFKNRPGSMPFPVEQAAREESKSFAKRTFESGIAVDIGQIGASERGFYFGFKAGHASRDEEVKALQDEVDDWRESARKAADETCGPMDGVHCTCVAVLRHEVAALRARLAAMREPLWVLREEHESEVADLRAKLSEAEGRAVRWVSNEEAQAMMFDSDGNRAYEDINACPSREIMCLAPIIPQPPMMPGDSERADAWRERYIAALPEVKP